MLQRPRHGVRPLESLPTLAEEGSAPSNPNHIRDARPRRPRKHRRNFTWDPTLDIYDDTFAFKQSAESHSASLQSISSDATLDVTLPANRRSTLFQQPAQKLPHATSLHPTTGNADIKRRRMSVAQRPLEGPPRSPSNTVQLQNIPEPTREMKKEPRRRTIYIPSDDTTIATIHPGAQSIQSKAAPRRPRQSDLFLEMATQTVHIPALTQEKPAADAQTLHRKPPHRSLAVAPRRAPLQQCTLMMQPVAITHDVQGSGDGKENIPPGLDCADDKKVNVDGIDLGPLKPSRTSLKLESPRASPKRRLSFAFGPAEALKPSSPSASPKPRLRVQHQTVTDALNLSSFSHSHDRRASLVPGQVGRQSMLSSSRSHVDRRCSMLQPPSRLSVTAPPQRDASKANFYPVLSGDVAKPELYEENWLSHQETAMTECINSLLTKSCPNRSAQPKFSVAIRDQLMGLYNDSSVSLLHRRLHASLRFGALSISKDTLVQVGRYKDDLQQRQRFLDLWMKTYDLQALQCAAEVVIGREIPQGGRLSGSLSRSSIYTSPARRRSLDLFLKTFLVRNEDASRPKTDPRSSILPGSTDGTDEDFGSQAWAWRRTIVRGLMIILLLDKAQQAGHLQGCLFQPSSPIKSSAAVVQTLGNLLFPSIGSISRVLEHLSFSVSHVQYPLEEHRYHVDNLATDMRDGVLLTRLVEILLFPPSSLEVQRGDVTVTLPSGDMLTSCFKQENGQQYWPLSQHLKYPCISRVQRLYNVELAISALTDVKGIDGSLHDIRAEDIVDGHREKTVGLLWTLLSCWGLSALVDFGLVKKETVRLRKIIQMQQHRRGKGHTLGLSLNDDDDAEAPFLKGLELQTHLLKTWATHAARLHGVTISNLSTSFADGNAYKALLQEYAACLPANTSPASSTHSTSTSTFSSSGPASSTQSTSSSTASTSLTASLNSLGCSRAFISLFAHSSNSNSNSIHIPTSRTTISLLAFLASRLLPAAQPHFAAQTIQRAWRRGQDRFELTRRVRCAVLARECRSVVLAQRRIVEAAVKIQRWWRRREGFWIRTRKNGLS